MNFNEKVIRCIFLFFLFTLKEDIWYVGVQNWKMITEFISQKLPKSRTVNRCEGFS